MTGEEALARIRGIMQQKLTETPAAQKLIEKINSGKADFNDTSLYARWAAINLGMCMSDTVCQIDLHDRPAVCKALLLDQYEDINVFLGMVQKELDSRFGLHIAPKKAPFPEERVEKLGNSLTDQTVPESTIQRRARAGTETVTKSFHDDYVKANARFRSRAGLKCYINRVSVNGCCKWCQEVSGRYLYDDAPKGIFRRHDNCDCTVIYDTQRGTRQVLRGTAKKWEVVSEGAGAGEPVVLTKEQAEKLQAEKQLKVLTNGEKHDIMNIRLDDIKTAVTGSPISVEVAEYIFGVLAEQQDQFKFDSVKVLALDPKIVMQTDPVQKGTFYDIVLNLNSAFLGGRSVEEIDEKLRQSNYTRANSLREAVIHEIYHGRLLYDKNVGEMEALHEILDDEHIDGVSPTAFKNGFECISEVGVLYERGETADIPQKAMDLFHYYMEVTP